MASSEIGVSKTRSAPKRSWRPGVTANTPPVGGDVLAEKDDRLVALQLLDDGVADRVTELERRVRAHGANSVACSAAGSG